MKNNTVFYDGECAMCNSLIRFLLKYDKSRSMRFISLQSQKAKMILKEHNILVDNADITTIYYLRSSTIKSLSSAMLSIFYDLGFPWKLLIVFKIVPKNIRDNAYRFISKNRYRFFGKQEFCALLSAEDRKRIIE